MLEETQETEEVIQRVAALDVGKAELTCCVRVPSPGKHGRRLQEVRSYQTMTRWLLVMADRLGELGGHCCIRGDRVEAATLLA